MSDGHYLNQPRIHGRRSVHETGATVVCGKCGRAFVLIEADRFAILLARAVAGTQKGG